MSKKNEKKKINKKTGISFIALLVFILMLVTSMNACGFFNSTSWKEEVLLHDGSKIIIKRLIHLGSKPTFESRERRALDETISFNLPGTNKEITWTTDFRDEKPEPNSLNPLIIDIVNGIPYIATYPAGCIAYNKWKRPNPPYIFLKHDGNDWKQIPLEEFPAEINKVNVIVGKPPEKLKKSFYTVAQVKEQNHDIHRAEYINIIRTPLKESDLCPEWITNGKGGWLGIDYFSTRASYEECVDVCKEVLFDIKYCPCDSLFKTKEK